jgi:L-histidine Nalpha-methyltransferase
MPRTRPETSPDGPDGLSGPHGPPIRFTDHLPADFTDRSLGMDVRTGFGGTPKWLPPKWFYDKVGSELFEEITRLPEYYPTRCERQILHRHAADLVAAAGSDTLVELGSGSSEKTRLLLDAMGAATGTGPAAGTGTDASAGLPGTGLHYVGTDVSEDALVSAAEGLRRDYPDLAIDIVRADFEHQLARLPGRSGRRTVAFLGSTLGNLEPGPRRDFLGAVRQALRSGEHLLLGVDLVKSPDVLLPAYDDAAGVTAAFNLNVLDVLNRRLRADFDRADFRHVAIWDADRERVEMRLRAVRELRVRFGDLDLAVSFTAGEELRTEVSTKFRRERLTAELHDAGFTESEWWTDDAGYFALSLWRAN